MCIGCRFASDGAEKVQNVLYSSFLNCAFPWHGSTVLNLGKTSSVGGTFRLDLSFDGMVEGIGVGTVCTAISSLVVDYILGSHNPQ